MSSLLKVGMEVEGVQNSVYDNIAISWKMHLLM